MKITKNNLKRMIMEELKTSLDESGYGTEMAGLVGRMLADMYEKGLRGQKTGL